LAVAWAGMGAVTYRLAAAPVRTSLILTARLDGLLAAQAKIDGTACFRVGTGTDRTALSWPWGYTARGSPLAPALGRRVAEVGQRVGMSGGVIADAVQSIPGCSSRSRILGRGDGYRRQIATCRCA